MKDLELLAGEFIIGELPKEKEYLKKYFKSHKEELIIYYFLLIPYEKKKTYGSLPDYFDNVIDHTGIFCKHKHLLTMHKVFTRIETALQKAMEKADHKQVCKIKNGKFDVRMVWKV